MHPPTFTRSALFLFLLTPLTLMAHSQGGEAAGFVTGLGHPVSGLDHVVAMVAVGLWGAQLGAPAVWLLPVLFPMVMALGGLLGLWGVPLPAVEAGIAISALVLGLLVLLELRLPPWLCAFVIAFFAVFHGYAHGTELPEGGSALMYSSGFVVATGLLHAVGIGLGTVHRWRWGRLSLRVAGGAICASGIYFLQAALLG